MQEKYAEILKNECFGRVFDMLDYALAGILRCAITIPVEASPIVSHKA